MLRRTVLRRCPPPTAAISAANLSWSRGDERPSKTALFPVGSVHEGFKVTRVTPIEDLRLTVFQFEHEITKSVVHHIDSNDKNNAFCMAFGTPATSDRGTTHVLEHTVLCGSQKYPVKDPFFHMLRRSLATFMNAMTGADYTIYPFATMNPQDYQNLLDVYLDAVFQPQLRADDFHQEGHRLEPVLADGSKIEKVRTDTAGAADVPIKGVEFNGVVYNEMLGVVSEPPRHFMQQVQRAMLPGTHYEYLSGGYPPAILDLTHEEVVDYHRRHYTPWNAVTLTYGDMDPRPALAAVHRYFVDMDAKATAHGLAKDRVPIPALTAWRPAGQAPAEVTKSGPSSVMGDPAKQTKVLVSYAIPPKEGADRLDRDTLVKLSVLDTLLTDGPASPMYKSLVSEGSLGQSYAPLTGFASHYTTPLLSFGVDQVDRAAVQPTQVAQAVDAALRAAIKDGFDARRVASTVFQTELSQRHRSANYGVNVCIGLAALAVTIRASPEQYLNWLPSLKEIARNPATLQDQLHRVTDPAANGHRACVTVHADPDYSKKLEGRLADRLKTKNAEFERGVAADPGLAGRTRTDHEQWLQRVHAPQVGDLLPTLKVADISPAILDEPPLEMVHDGVELIKTEANGLVYVSMLIPAAEGTYDPQRFQPGSPEHDKALMMPLLTSLVTALGTAKHDFEEFDVEAQLVASHFGFGKALMQRAEKDSEFIAGHTSGFYTTVEKLEEALAMLRSVLLEPRESGALSRKERQVLSKMVCSRAARKAEGIQRNGHHIAAMRSYAKVNFAASINDALSGLTQAQFMEKLKCRLTSGDEATANACIDQILAARDERIADIRDRAHRLGADVWAVCDGRHAEAVGLALRDFRQAITQNTSVMNRTPRTCQIDHEIRPVATLRDDGLADKETIELPINASYAGVAFVHGLQYMTKEQQALRVALQLLKSEFLHTEIRELGGAYGVTTEATMGGIAGGIALASYRDPTPDRSLSVFRQSAAWLADSKNVTAQRVDEAKLRLFSAIDHPVTCSSYGSKARINGLTREGEQRVRDMLLAVQVEDVLAIPAVLNKAVAHAAVLAPRSATAGAPV